MKKFAILVLSLVLIVATVAFVACNKDEEPQPCNHQVLDANGAQLLCKNVDFESSMECSLCGEMLTGKDLVAAVEHRTPWTLNAVEATCTEDGVTEGKKCLNCNKTLVEQEVVPALGHEIVNTAATAATCTVPAYSAGTQCSRCEEYFSGHEETADPLGHDFSHGNYFAFVECIRECGVYGKLTGGNPFKTEFIYDFDENKQAEIDLVYTQLSEAIESGTESSANVIALFEAYDELISYIQAQYQFARILNDIEYSAASRAEFSALSEYYNTTISRYYTLFKDIDNSNYKNDFWTWTEWDADYIQHVLDTADSYDLDNRNAVDQIIEDYEDLLGKFSSKGPSEAQLLELFDLYSQLVVANNNIATTAGYNNYMEYAYDRVYERDYTPADVSAMRALVKQNIGPILADVAHAYKQWDYNYQYRGGWSSRASQLYYSQYVGNWMWGNPGNYTNDAERLGMVLNSRQSIVDYFTFLSEGDTNVDFYGAVENLFKTGNFFMGANTNITAYTWYVYSKDTPILVFGGDDKYQDAFTFIHEFGHYYQFVHNGLLSVPMDHDETQSQGNEMLFLAWLRANMPTGVEEGFEILELEQLLNMLGSIVLSTAVDEFEYLVYTGATEFDGQPIPTVDGSDLIDYATLYETILEAYWDGIGDWFNTSYWMYVTFDNAAYYISYAMSALPCLELYAKAGNDGLNAARASYLKLFTFSSNQDFVAEDSFGDLYVTKTYQEVLNWAGLGGPFQQNLYDTISAYFESRS